MDSRASAIALGIVMVVVVVAVDLLFLRDHVLARLVVNIAIVAAFGLVYFLVVRRR